MLGAIGIYWDGEQRLVRCLAVQGMPVRAFGGQGPQQCSIQRLPCSSLWVGWRGGAWMAAPGTLGRPELKRGLRTALPSQPRVVVRLLVRIAAASWAVHVGARAQQV